MLLTLQYLNLGHSGPTSSDPTATEIGTTTAAGKAGEDQRAGVSQEPKPEECSHGLRLVAALGHVVRTVGDEIIADVVLVRAVSNCIDSYRTVLQPTHLIATAMYSELRCERNTGDKEQQRIDEVDGEHEHRVDGEALIDGGGKEIEEREHREYRDEHGVIDDGRVACECLVDHVSHKRHDQEGP